MSDAATSAPATITLLIDRANSGNAEALNALFATLYPELHALAHARIRRNRQLTLLDTTALLHESYLRFVRLGQLNVGNRAHFLAYAARTMRSIVVDFARARLAQRRGGGGDDAILDTDAALAGTGEEEVIRVHEALDELRHADERLVRVVEMRYFGGLTEDEIGSALGITDRTVRRMWDKARVMLEVALR
ncbi:MAG TPA: ECF-type sigma factor [Casimicrobiaceae bacterium]|nr:ECF-type sigma factor [Casimicrobiaceae bacterium]